MTPRTVRVFAPAKVNLALHVTGQRVDGYHLLDSLVTFLDVGDVLSVTEGMGSGLTVSGPFAAQVPSGSANFIYQVAELFDFTSPLAFHLEKNLPVASGIGGGSADAGACLRGLVALGGEMPDTSVQLAIGADLPMCANSVPARVGGIGETLKRLPDLPVLHLVLVNPGVAVSTPAVFGNLLSKSNPPMTDMPTAPEDFLAWLIYQRNDLQDAAIGGAAIIKTVLTTLEQVPGCKFSRMSGSGATCFGVFDSAEQAQNAARELSANQPDWWVVAAKTDGADRAEPQFIRSTT